MFTCSLDSLAADQHEQEHQHAESIVLPRAIACPLVCLCSAARIDLEALEEDELAAEREVREEFWVAEKVNSLIYRMLVLNTGQVPWETGRQLETVYG